MGRGGGRARNGEAPWGRDDLRKRHPTGRGWRITERVRSWGLEENRQNALSREGHKGA